MNATLVVAASSLILACVAFAFFLLHGGSDELTGSKSGTMTFAGEGHEFHIKYQGMVGDDVMSLTIFIEDGDKVHSALWVKTFKDGEYESEEILLNDAATYDVVEFENDVAISCRKNKGRDKKAINNMIGSIDYSGESDSYTITEDGFDGTPTTVSVTASVGDVTMPEFDWSTCQSIGDPIDPFRNTTDGDGHGSRALELEVMVETNRVLGVTDASRAAQDVYESSRSEVICKTTTSVFGDFEGQACYLQRGCSFAFRGSDDNADWSDNILGSLSNELIHGVRIHKGFLNQLEHLLGQTSLGVQIEGCSHPIFIGHSLGGAIASVAHTYFGKGEINTYAGPAPYWRFFEEPCSGGGAYQHCYWKWNWSLLPSQYQVCETRYRDETCPTSAIHVQGKRTYHEYDPVPYATNLVGYNHGGGIGYKIEWIGERPWWCFMDWCENRDDDEERWQLNHQGVTNEPTSGFFDSIIDIGRNIVSVYSGEGHYHSMSQYYQFYGV